VTYPRSARPACAGPASHGAGCESPSVAVRQIQSDELSVCLEIRQSVFVVEQAIDAALEADGLDPECTHLLAQCDGDPVGTARLREPAGLAKAERVAVRADARRTGVGRALMAALEAVARARGHRVLHLAAQVPVVPFYERLGYRAVGEQYEEAGIPHRRMQKAL
jgi:predicted GNAT family N-acyltransferase